MLMAAWRGLHPAGLALLQLHHVRHDPNYLSWDLLWLVADALIALWGLYLKRVTE